MTSELLLRSTISEVARHGVFSINARHVCLAAGVSFGAVSHNFGSWDGLLAAATALAYREYIEELWLAAQVAPRDPVSRLSAWIRAQVDYGRRMSGWSAVINYPTSFERISELLRDQHGEEMKGLLELNLARLGQLTIDVREDTVTDFSFGVGEFPRAQMLADMRAVARSTTVGWSALGMAVWAGSAGTRAQNVPEMDELFSQILEFNIGEIISSIQRDRP